MIIEDTQILQILRTFNKWWQFGKVPAEYVKKSKRFAFYEVKKYLEKKDFNRAILLSGIRRVGKTTILLQIANEMIKEKKDPKNILYITFDHPILKMVSIDRILSVYKNNISADENIVLLLDEVQYASDWSTWIKLMVDFNKEYKIIATGSAYSLIKNNVAESGVGRWIDISVPALTFYEYLDLTETLPVVGIKNTVNPIELPNLTNIEIHEIVNSCIDLEKYFHKYLLLGGFPEIALLNNIEESQQFLKEDIIDKVLKRDMIELFGIRNTLQLEQIFVYLCMNTGQIIVKEKISSEMGLNNLTVESYLSSLELSNLIHKVGSLDIGGKKSLKQKYKIYLTDAALRNAILLKGDDVLTIPEEMGLIVETAVFNHINYFIKNKIQIGYWRENKTDKEVDIVVKMPKEELLAFEVKYRENVRISSDDGLVKLANERKDIKPFIVTKGSEQIGTFETGGIKIFKIPAFLFLYLFGAHRSLKLMS